MAGFYLKKLISSFFLPPGLFLVLIAAAIIVLKIKRYLKTIFFVTLIIIGGLIYLLSTEPVSDALILPLENSSPPYSFDEKARAIAVLGGGTFACSPDESTGGSSVHGSLYPEPMKRVYYTFRIYKDLKCRIIVSGGKVSVRKSYESEADIMKRVLVTLGVPESKIICEDMSRNTFENLFNIKRILDKHHIKGKLIIVSSAYHMKRIKLAAERLKLDIIPAPTDYLTNRAGYDFTSFLPRAFYLLKSSIALREYIGILYYRIKY